MDQEFNAWICDEAKAALVKKSVKFEDNLDNFEVIVKILHCGVCFSDVGLLHGHYGQLSKYPMVAGHEGAGVIVKIGDKVTHHKIGDRVGKCFIYEMINIR